MNQEVYIASVQIAVFADSEAEACDSMTECLTNNLKYNAAIIDWQYISEGGEYKYPKSIGLVDTDNFEEGELFLNEGAKSAEQFYNALKEIDSFNYEAERSRPYLEDIILKLKTIARKAIESDNLKLPLNNPIS